MAKRGAARLPVFTKWPSSRNLLLISLRSVVRSVVTCVVTRGGVAFMAPMMMVVPWTRRLCGACRRNRHQKYSYGCQ
jgi:hypothetical protein